MDTYYNQEINLDSYNQTQEYQLSSSLEENQNIYEEKDLLNNGNFENNTTELESLKNLNSYDEPNNYQVNEPFIETTNTSSSVMLGDKETIANTPNIDNGYNQSSSSFLDIGNSSNTYNINTLGGNQTLESTNTDSYNKILPIKYLKPVTIPSENYLHIPPSSDYNLDSNNKLLNQRLYPKLEVILSTEEPKNKTEGYQGVLKEEERKQIEKIMNTKKEQNEKNRTRGGRGRGRGQRGRGRRGGFRGRRGFRGRPRRGDSRPRRGESRPRGRGQGTSRGTPARGRGRGNPRGNRGRGSSSSNQNK